MMNNNVILHIIKSVRPPIAIDLLSVKCKNFQFKMSMHIKTSKSMINPIEFAKIIDFLALLSM